MTGDATNFVDALHSGRFSTAWLLFGPSLDRRTPKSKVKQPSSLSPLNSLSPLYYLADMNIFRIDFKNLTCPIILNELRIHNDEKIY